MTKADSDHSGPSPDAADRRRTMALLARASAHEISHGLAEAGLADTSFTVLRPPEVGLAMVRGRQGATGAPFNLGEASVTRAAVRTEDGNVGIAYVLGREPEKAHLAALADALWQSARHRELIVREVLEPVSQRLAAENSRRRGETSATTVDFFTMVRGDD